MKHIITTTAILLASTFSVQAQTLDEAVEAAVTDYMAKAAEYDVTLTAHNISGVASAAATVWNSEHGDADLAATQAELVSTTEQLIVANVQVQDANNNAILANSQAAEAYNELHVTQEAKAVIQSRYNSLTMSIEEADNAPYKSMGNVLQTSKDNGTYSGVSYDKGTINAAISESLTTPYAQVGNIRIQGKYHNFNLEEDVKLVNTEANIENFNSLITQVHNTIYNEGYKDGYNDGFEDGFNVGWHSAVTAIKATESPL